MDQHHRTAKVRSWCKQRSFLRSLMMPNNDAPGRYNTGLWVHANFTPSLRRFWTTRSVHMLRVPTAGCCCCCWCCECLCLTVHFLPTRWKEIPATRSPLHSRFWQLNMNLIQPGKQEEGLISFKLYNKIYALLVPNNSKTVTSCEHDETGL